MINSNFGPISHRFRNTVTYNLKLSIENCGQTAADGDMVLLWTAYNKSPALYSIIPSPIHYDLPFSHNTSVKDDGQTDRQTTTVPKTLKA